MITALVVEDSFGKLLMVLDGKSIIARMSQPEVAAG